MTAVVTMGSCVMYDLGEFDSSRPLVIDPGIVFSTFIGTDGNDRPNDMIIDDEGYCYIAGVVYQTTMFPKTPGAYVYNGTQRSGVYVLKMDPNGTDLEFSAFIGSDSPVVLRGMALDVEGNVYLTGHCTDTTFPVTNGAFDTSHGGSSDGFILKLDSNASTLVFSTLIGGDSHDFPFDIDVDHDGNVFVVGSTWSKDFPTTVGARDTVMNGEYGGFLLHLSSDGSQLEYSTFIDAGGGDDVETCHLSPSGTVYLTGSTSSQAFPTTNGAYDRSFNGWVDCFLMEFDIVQSSIVYSTFIGGNGLDAPDQLAIDGEGDVYVTGITYSSDFPTTSGAYDRHLDGNSDTFILKFDTGDWSLDYSTLYGGSTAEHPNDIFIDPTGVAYVTGSTTSTDLPTTENAWSSDLGGEKDVYCCVISKDGTSLVYSTYLGGSGTEEACGVAIDPRGFLVLSGDTRSMDFPTTLGSYDSTYNDMSDIFITWMDLVKPEIISSRLPDNITTGDPFTVYLEAKDNLGLKDVTFEYWVGDSDIHSNASFIKVSGDNRSANWSLDLICPDHSIDVLNFIVKVRDIANNINSAVNGTIPIIDNDPPVIDAASPSPEGFGQVFSLDVIVVDNVQVDQVDIVIWFGPDPGETSTFRMEPTVTEDHYIVEITAPMGFIGTVSYFFEGLDTSGNLNSSRTFTTVVADAERPSILSDLSNDVATTGDTFHFEVEVVDNIGVDSVLVVYRFGTAPWVAAFNITMEPKNISGQGNGTYELDSIVVDPYSLAPLSYYFIVIDTTGHQDSSGIQVVDVVDDDAPEIVEDLTSAHPVMGRTIEFSVEMIDNFGVTFTYLHHNIPGLPSERVKMTGQGNGTYSLELPIPDGWRGPLNYSIESTDIHWNTQRSTGKSLTVYDEDAPSLTWWRADSGSVPVKGLDFILHAESRDNADVPELFCEYWYGDGGRSNVTMILEDGSGSQFPFTHSLTISILRDITGPMQLIFKAVDSSGNWNVSEPVSFELVNRPPTIAILPTWDVTEEEQEQLDLTAYVSDINDPLEDLSISVDHPALSAEGLVLFAEFEEWTEQFTLDIVFTDGEDEVTRGILIRVKNVNDEPVILEMTPETGSEFSEGETISFVSSAEDEDDDELSFTWLDNGIIIGTGNILTKDNLGPGTHSITIVVTDGMDTISMDVEIEVLSEEVSLVGPMLIIMAVIVLGVLIGIYLMRKRGAGADTETFEEGGTD